MVEVGIPVYKARDTLPKALDSLVAQTKDRFITCLSIDGDNENYDDIIEEYKRRGLKMRIIRSAVNGGPGVARQKILETTQCEYLMYLDSDDMLMPRSVEVLFNAMRSGKFDIIRSSFIREEKNKQDIFLPQNIGTITWFHGKIYRTAFLRDINLSFLPIRTDEDAYFNLVAWNSTQYRGELNEITYIWRANQQSLTRKSSTKEYFSNTYMNYITSQVEGMKKLAEVNGGVSDMLIPQTLINIYNYYMQARFYKIPENDMDAMISTLKDELWMQLFFKQGQGWVNLVKSVPAGEVFENQFVVFYDESFNKWAKRLLINDPNNNS